MPEPTPAERQVPFHRPSIGPQDEAALLRVLRSGWLTLGPETAAFEQDFAAYINVSHALGVSSCTAGLELIFAALELPAGSEVITTPLTFAATVHVLVHRGLTPVLADVRPDTLCIDAASVAKRVTDRTSAVLAVHYAGHLAPVDELAALCANRGLILIEDCAHAIETRAADGRAAGAFGAAASFSFYPNKNMTAAEGGMVATADEALAARMRLLRTQGLQAPPPDPDAVGFRPYDVLAAGYKYAMTDLQAALGRTQLAQVEGWLPRRAAIAAQYAETLRNLGGRIVEPSAGGRSAWHLAVAEMPMTSRAATEVLMQRVQRRGVMLSWHYRPIHWLSFYQGTAGGQALPVCDEIAARTFSLPLYPTLKDDELNYVCRVLEEEASA